MERIRGITDVLYTFDILQILETTEPVLKDLVYHSTILRKFAVEFSYRRLESCFL